MRLGKDTQAAVGCLLSRRPPKQSERSGEHALGGSPVIPVLPIGEVLACIAIHGTSGAGSGFGVRPPEIVWVKFL